MIRKCHNYRLQTNLQHCEEETKDIVAATWQKKTQSKATSTLFLSEIIAKLERDYKDQTQYPLGIFLGLIWG